MTEQEPRTGTEANPSDEYRAPSIEVLGRVAELTQGLQTSIDV